KNADNTSSAAMAARMRPTSSVMVLSRFAARDGRLSTAHEIGTTAAGLSPSQLIARGAVPMSAARDLAGEELARDGRWNIAGDEGLTDGAHQDQGQPSRPYFFVLAHDAEQGFGVELLGARDMADRGGQAARGKVRLHAGYAVAGDMAQLLGQAKR